MFGLHANHMVLQVEDYLHFFANSIPKCLLQMVEATRKNRITTKTIQALSFLSASALFRRISPQLVLYGESICQTSIKNYPHVGGPESYVLE